MREGDEGSGRSLVDLPTELLLRVASIVPGEDVVALQRSAPVLNALVKASLDQLKRIPAGRRSLSIEWDRKKIVVNEDLRTKKNFSQFYVVYGSCQVCREGKPSERFTVEADDVWTIALKTWKMIISRLEVRQLELEGLEEGEVLEVLEILPKKMVKKFAVKETWMESKNINSMLGLLICADEVDLSQLKSTDIAETRFPFMEKLRRFKVVGQTLTAGIDDEWLAKAKSLEYISAPTCLSLKALRNLLEDWKYERKEVKKYTLWVLKSNGGMSREQALEVFHDCEPACAARRFREGHFVTKHDHLSCLTLAFYSLPDDWKLQIEEKH